MSLELMYGLEVQCYYDRLSHRTSTSKTSETYPTQRQWWKRLLDITLWAVGTVASVVYLDSYVVIDSQLVSVLHRVKSEDISSRKEIWSCLTCGVYRWTMKCGEKMLKSSDLNGIRQIMIYWEMDECIDGWMIRQEIGLHIWHLEKGLEYVLVWKWRLSKQRWVWRWMRSINSYGQVALVVLMRTFTIEKTQNTVGSENEIYCKQSFYLRIPWRWLDPSWLRLTRFKSQWRSVDDHTVSNNIYSVGLFHLNRLK